MPPRFTLTLNASAALRIGRLAVRRQARYSTEANGGPLVRVTDLPAPNSGHIRILELNRPAARNAISRALLSSLRDEIDAIHAQYDAATGEEVPTPSWNKRFGGIAGEDQKGPTRALILASAVDTSFCAGADLKERKTFSQEEYVVLPVFQHCH
jgi:methylglutaconyl-CoA hydratase